MLIATDLDGTLVPNASEGLSQRGEDVLRRLDAAGIPVVFVTGRPLRWMSGFWPHVGRDGVGIVSNGAITYDAHAEEVISLRGIDPGPGLELVAAITDSVPGATFAIECRDGIRKDPAYVDAHRSPPSAPRGSLADMWDVPAVKLLVRHATMLDEEFRDTVIETIGEQAHVTWSIPGLVEVSAAGVTKASALSTLCARLGVSAEDVVAFGDMPNDLPMLQWAGTAYAVANAHQSVRATADRIAPPCHEDGVVRVLESILATRDHGLNR
ncbi:MAG: HAD hydrolase family protein [Ornithinimicrobium sp.]